MKDYNQVKKVPFKTLKGISEKTISIHHDKLYEGYVKKWQEIQEKLKKIDISLANASYSELRELKLEESFAANGILLHENYFDILGGDGKPEGKILEAIENDFGSFGKWQEEFKAIGLSARGWAILAYDFNDGKLHNYLADAHNQYGIWGAAPLIALDVYEHSYFIDYGADRKSYLEAFFANLNWKAINKKFEKIMKMKR
ncbi:MAG: superoxide dismutase [Minisyncoccales bacterium]